MTKRTSFHLPIHFCFSLFFLVFLNDGFSQKAKIPPIVNKVKYSASSSMPSSYGFYYTPEMAADGNLRTWWSPATYNRETSWLQISYNRYLYLNYIDIHAGSHYPNFKNLGDLYPLNLRVKVAVLEFADGSIEKIYLSDIDEIQTIYFPLKYSSYIRIRPLEYYASEKWNDPCISYFYAGKK